MTSSTETRVVLDRVACDLAFHAGQLFERLLTEQAIEVARQSGTGHVTIEHVRSCLDEVTVDQLLRQVKESAHDRRAA